MRMAKWWVQIPVNVKIADKKARPTSYLIDLLVIHAFEQVQNDKKRELGHRSVFIEFFETVQQGNLKICWTKHYDFDQITWRIVDPANPTALVECSAAAREALRDASANLDWATL